MGCTCVSVKGINPEECNFEEEKNSSTNNIILKNKRNSSKSNIQEIEIMQSRFREELKDKEDYEILDSINIQEYLTYECLQAFEKYRVENKKFNEICDNYNSTNDLSDLLLDKRSNDNDNENNNYITFKMPPIKYLKNNSIYEGEFFFDDKKEQFIYAGNGMLITPQKEFIHIKNQPKNSKLIENGGIFYPNGDIFIGKITKEEPYSKIKGILFENVNGNYDNYIKSDNFNFNSPYIIKHFANGDIYEGEATLKNNKFVFNGKGQLIKRDSNSIFKGDFHGNLYNGQGQLFFPLGGLSQERNIKDNIGKTIISHWLNGKANGKGLIQEKYSNKENVRNTTCSFRFGKIIKSTTCLIKKKAKLHENIFSFMELWEISPLIKYLKIKGLYNYLKKDSFYNLTKVKIYNALNKYDVGSYRKDIFNNELFKLKIYNFNEIMKNILENKSNFLPFVCYWADGGEIEHRYRPYHIFDPDITKIYSTNYLTHKNANITIKGIFNKNLYEEYKKTEEQIYDIQEENIYNLMNMASLYKILYKHFEKSYPVRKIDTDIIEYNQYILSDKAIGNLNNILCTIQCITILIQERIDDLTVIMNPCNFLSVYIGNYNNMNSQEEDENENEINTNISKRFIDINYNEVKEKNYNLKMIREKYSDYIINEEYDKKYEYIEFDTNKQKEYDYKILCLVKINEKNDSTKPYIINLKKFYHIGNVVNVKMINQYNCYNKSYNGFSIDLGTIHFYGDVIYLNE